MELRFTYPLQNFSLSGNGMPKAIVFDTFSLTAREGKLLAGIMQEALDAEGTAEANRLIFAVEPELLETEESLNLLADWYDLSERIDAGQALEAINPDILKVYSLASRREEVLLSLSEEQIQVAYLRVSDGCGEPETFMKLDSLNGLELRLLRATLAPVFSKHSMLLSVFVEHSARLEPEFFIKAATDWEIRKEEIVAGFNLDSRHEDAIWYANIHIEAIKQLRSLPGPHLHESAFSSVTVSSDCSTNGSGQNNGEVANSRIAGATTRKIRPATQAKLIKAMQYRSQGMTVDEIAPLLHYEDHSGVVKLLKLADEMVARSLPEERRKRKKQASSRTVSKPEKM